MTLNGMLTIILGVGAIVTSILIKDKDIDILKVITVIWIITAMIQAQF